MMSSSCNPIFSAFQAHEYNVTLAATPIAVTTPNPICPLITNSTCCNVADYAAISSASDQTRAALESTVQNFNGALASIQNLQGTLETIANDCLPADLRDIFTQVFDQFTPIIDAVNQAAQQFSQTVSPCMEDILKLNVGMACLACDGTDQFYSLNNNTGMLSVNLNQQVCTDLGDTCAPFLLSVGDLVATVTNLTSNLGGSFDNIPNLRRDDNGMICTDSASCRTVICQGIQENAFGVGLAAAASIAGGNPVGKLPFNITMNGNQIDCASIVGNSNSRREDDSFKSYVLAELGEILSEIAAMMPIQDRHQPMRRGVQATSQFTTNGYDAVAAGGSSSINTQFYTSGNDVSAACPLITVAFFAVMAALF